MAQRYGCLPSEVLQRATTFDLEILDIAKSYERMKQNKANGIMPEVKQETLLAAMESLKK
jgi:hypothetical protein